MEWYEKDKVEASDLLDMQQAVTNAEEAQAKAWREYQHAIAQVPILEQAYESRKWDAECAREEFSQMRDAIKALEEYDMSEAVRVALRDLLDTLEYEYGWRSFFDNGEEYEWLNCSSREDAEAQIQVLQTEEDADNPGDGHLTYSLWRRWVFKAGEWEKVS